MIWSMLKSGGDSSDPTSNELFFWLFGFALEADFASLGNGGALGAVAATWICGTALVDRHTLLFLDNATGTGRIGDFIRRTLFALTTATGSCRNGIDRTTTAVTTTTSKESRTTGSVGRTGRRRCTGSHPTSIRSESCCTS